MLKNLYLEKQFRDDTGRILEALLGAGGVAMYLPGLKTNEEKPNCWNLKPECQYPSLCTCKGPLKHQKRFAAGKRPVSMVTSVMRPEQKQKRRGTRA